ncbi:hypothetical protein [Bradyrhizobium sp. NBAIM01]|uniref:hypothetical protein n=1 Tax=Bradyrhizobium sp. NBAIM01 TaxID=2793818 RepID=UPI001CD1D119|nr:hypothetical protein [Bradyrhizobium sp. NBAIM01]MCA1514558.1 hypothetical protein [Bradyrhizobium sp. NBAIM01]
MFKFLRSRDVNSILGGSVLIRPLSFYRRIEEEGGKPWIGDRLEYTSEVLVQHISDRTTDLLKRIAPAGMPAAISPMEGAKDWSARNLMLSYTFIDDPWVFCASDGDLKQLTKIMCDGSEDGYDACIKIKDFGAFVTHLYRMGRVNDKPLAVLFKGSRCDQVKYDRVSLLIEEGPPPAPNPFLKDVKFSDQQEARYVLLPANPIAEDTLFVKFPDPDKYLVREF